MKKTKTAETGEEKHKYLLDLDRVSSEPLQFLKFKHEGIQAEMSGDVVRIAGFKAQIDGREIFVPAGEIPLDEIPCYLYIIETEKGAEIVSNKNSGRYVVGHLSGIIVEERQTIIRGWIR